MLYLSLSLSLPTPSLGSKKNRLSSNPGTPGKGAACPAVKRPAGGTPLFSSFIEAESKAKGAIFNRNLRPRRRRKFHARGIHECGIICNESPTKIRYLPWIASAEQSRPRTVRMVSWRSPFINNKRSDPLNGNRSRPEATLEPRREKGKAKPLVAGRARGGKGNGASRSRTRLL